MQVTRILQKRQRERDFTGVEKVRSSPHLLVYKRAT
jgi:hypothetical protein